MRVLLAEDDKQLADRLREDLSKRGFVVDVAGDGVDAGLGLAIVRDIVSSYGGELSLGRSSRLGGMLVSVSIPADGGLRWRTPDPDTAASTRPERRTRPDQFG